MKPAALGRAAGDVFTSVLLFQATPEGERPAVGALRAHLLERLDAFAKRPEAKAAPPEDVKDAHFALVAWADEIINVSGWQGAAEWQRDPLQLQLFGTRRGGVEFFEHLEKLRRENEAALEVYFLALALGFQGSYAGREGDRRVVLQRTLEKLRSVERALNLGREKRLVPSGYRVAIELRGRGSRLVRRLLLVGGGLLLLFAMLWGALFLFAGGVRVLGAE